MQASGPTARECYTLNLKGLRLRSADVRPVDCDDVSQDSDRDTILGGKVLRRTIHEARKARGFGTIEVSGTSAQKASKLALRATSGSLPARRVCWLWGVSRRFRFRVQGLGFTGKFVGRAAPRGRWQVRVGWVGGSGTCLATFEWVFGRRHYYLSACFPTYTQRHTHAFIQIHVSHPLDRPTLLLRCLDKYQRHGRNAQ